MAGSIIADVRVDRVFLFAALFYGIQGMNVGGTRLLRIAPHLAFGEQGVQDIIPPNAVLTAKLARQARRTLIGLWDGVPQFEGGPA